MVKLLPASSLLRSSLRFFLQHPWQFWLTLLSIALGTAVMVAVDLANASARESFSRSIEQVSGHMSHHIVSRNEQAGVPESFYYSLRVEHGFRRSAPVVQQAVSIQGKNFYLTGIDPFAEPLFSSDEDALPFDASSATALLAGDGQLVMSKAAWQRLKLPKQFALDTGKASPEVHVAAFYPASLEVALDEILLADIATAQHLLQQPGRLERIELILDNEADINRLQALLPASLKLIVSPARSNALEQMTRAFRTNLQAMSLLAVLVGAFLVYNTMTFSVLQRRRQFAIERMLGVTGRDLFVQILLEALVIGVVGAVLGIVLGIALGQGLLLLMTQSINDLYASVKGISFTISPLSVGKGLGVTLLAVVLATLAPAREAAQTPPVSVNRSSVLEQHFQRLLLPALLLGVFFAVMALLLLWLFQRSLLAGFAAMFLMVIAWSLWIPLMTARLLDWLADRASWLGTLPAMAVRSVANSLSRTNLALIALAIAVSATIGVSIMISSFRASVAQWLDMTLQSDIYISAVNPSASRVEGVLPPALMQQVESLPGIASVSSVYSTRIIINDAPVVLMVLNPGKHGHRGFRFIAGDADTLWPAFFAGEGVFISEPLAYHQGLTPGDMIHTEDAQGRAVNLKVGAIFQDYAATQGMVVMSPAHYQQYWEGQRISSIGLDLEPQVSIEAVRQQLSDLTANLPGSFSIRSYKGIKEATMTIFDRTFAITNVLRILVILVAFVGVFSALMAVLLEKTREYSVLRATGLTAPQLSRMIMLQTLLLGLLAGLFALPLGWALSEALIQVINQRSFGWSMKRLFPLWVIPEALLLSMAAALLAGWYPARRLRRLNISRGLRE